MLHGISAQPLAGRLHGGTCAAQAQVQRALGGALRGMLACGRVRRVVVAGGDSSGEVAGALGIEALQVLAHLVPGAPLCRGHSQDAACDGLQIVLKGGQMGDAAFFGTVLAGQAPPGRDVSRA
jgi:uncharacterized protein YgbK (DUF1537 family)